MKVEQSFYDVQLIDDLPDARGKIEPKTEPEIEPAADISTWIVAIILGWAVAFLTGLFYIYGMIAQ